MGRQKPAQQVKRRRSCASCNRRRVVNAADHCVACAQAADDGTRRVVIVYDGAAWHVRALRVIEHDLERDEKVYRCDHPVANNVQPMHAMHAAEKYLHDGSVRGAK